MAVLLGNKRILHRRRRVICRGCHLSYNAPFILERNRDMRKIFPTFDEIDKGYCIYERTGAFKGYEEDGTTPIFGRRRSLIVSIAHGYFHRHISVIVTLDYKMKRNGFKYGREGKCFSRRYEYSERGYNEMLQNIRRDLWKDADLIYRLVEDLREV